MFDIKNYIFLSLFLWCANVLANEEQASSVPSAQECSQPDFVQTKRREYPSNAIKNGNMGAVIFQFSIDEKGSVFDAEMVGTNAIPVLQRTATKRELGSE